MSSDHKRKGYIMKQLLGFCLGLALLWSGSAFAQNAVDASAVRTQPSQSQFYTTPISATAAINTQTTLTIPAPTGGQFNYICLVAFNVAQSSTGAANALQVTTSTNFNSFALKVSWNAVATQASYDWIIPMGTPATGCAKSAAANTATTFISPAAIAQSAFSWYALYYQAP